MSLFCKSLDVKLTLKSTVNEYIFCKKKKKYFFFRLRSVTHVSPSFIHPSVLT